MYTYTFFKYLYYLIHQLFSRNKLLSVKTAVLSDALSHDGFQKYAYTLFLLFFGSLIFTV